MGWNVKIKLSVQDDDGNEVRVVTSVDDMAWYQAHDKSREAAYQLRGTLLSQLWALYDSVSGREAKP